MIDSLDEIIIEAINTLRSKRKRPDEQSIFDSLKSINKCNDSNITFDIVNQQLSDMINRKIIINKTSDNKSSFYVNDKVIKSNPTIVTIVPDTQDITLMPSQFNDTFISPRIIPPTQNIVSPTSAERLINETFENLNQSEKQNINKNAPITPPKFDILTHSNSIENEIVFLKNKVKELETESNRYIL